MPKGPQGQKRPGDTIGAAVMVARIATGEIEESKKAPHGQAGGKKGGVARAKVLPKKKRLEIAKKAIKARWGKSGGKLKSPL